MTARKALATILFSIFVTFSIGGQQALAQGAASGPSQEAKVVDETNLDTQLYLLVATNQEVDDTKLPAALDSVVKQLRASLPFKNYKLISTLVNRVKNEGRLSLKWVGGPLPGSAAASPNTPSFNEFKVNHLKFVTDSGGRQLVRMDGFVFGARIPIVTGTAIASNGPAAPIINYEQTGLNTDISIREGEPVVVGTLNVGPSGDAIILVMSAKRANK
ncbi:MAG TPA: hypothetical protein VNO50_22670 [Pyrinomonadaceae bacterium]|nr:hypothetical protein [Pyrinomonadaceae bacterium]